MNASQLLDHFDRISDAPDAVPRLRRFILDLAVRGKLVGQDPSDEPASHLLEDIQAESGKQGNLRSGGSGTPVASAEVQWEIPSSWIWVRFGEIIVSRDGERIPVSKEERNRLAKTYDYYGASGVIDKIDRYIFDKPLLLIGEDGANLINRSSPIAFLARGKYWVNNHAHVLDGISETFLRFIELHINATDLKPYVTGTAQPKMNQAKMNSIPIALPPLSEQHRIVTKVDELMALCDRLEAAQAERDRRRDRLTAASLQRVNAPADASAFRRHADFHLRHLARTTTRPDQIQVLREAILNLAVRGKLVRQESGDELAIHLERSDGVRQVAAKRDRRVDRERQVLLAGDERWNVPSSWEWRGLADLVLFIDYRGRTPNKVEKGVRLITAKNVKKGHINLLPEEFLSEATYQTWMTRGLPANGDVLFTTEAPMGNAAVVDLNERFGLAQRLICLRPYGALDPAFLKLQIIAEPFQAILDKTATGLTAKGIKAAKLKRLPIAIPPLAEQHRIVAKVGELMTVCDRLEAQLTATRTESRRLLEAVLHQALTPAV